MTTKPFWETRSLSEMSPQEWESLCDGCGLCCLIRFEDEDTGDITPTQLACSLFDDRTCRCSNYAERERHVPDCIKLTPGNIATLPWMPLSCAYRRLHEGKPLPVWHPLVTGDPESVHAAGVSVRGVTISEDLLDEPEDALAYSAPELLVDRSERVAPDRRRKGLARRASGGRKRSAGR
jgi:uncharacterized cysteine cluster protein YcgN (CxxCxxCC family)